MHLALAVDAERHDFPGQPIGDPIGVFRSRQVRKGVGAGCELAREMPPQQHRFRAGQVEAVDEDHVGGHGGIMRSRGPKGGC